jgi:enoyl-CoA hydratase/carnithine racemase
MSDILTHIDAGVMTLTFNRLDKKNSITGDMYAAMAQAVDQAQATPPYGFWSFKVMRVFSVRAMTLAIF